MSRTPDPPAEPVEQERPVGAVFDFDGTLTHRDSLLPFLWQVAGPWAFIWNGAVLLPTLLRYALGTLKNGPAKERVLGQFLAGKPTGEIRTVAESFARHSAPAKWQDLQWSRSYLIDAETAVLAYDAQVRGAYPLYFSLVCVLIGRK